MTDRMNYKWRIDYKPPLQEIDYDNINTLPKVFYINVYECPSKLDLAVKIEELKKLYNMKEEYIVLVDLEG